MENREQIVDKFDAWQEVFDDWQGAIFSLQNDVQMKLSTMLQGGEVLSREAIVTSVNLCQDILNDLLFLESQVEETLKNLQLMMDQLPSGPKRRRMQTEDM
ncbi:Protein of unknown function [Gryllus bimaculatus]|nr:Protein of unknown function [Gryllus bimaculatus]